ncbi:nucleotidyltransferase family protein [Pseudoroseicyclus sp. CLL3-39]|uniref:Nucleotidyltransferase family protein n=2 Tax=Pseudoroseicyclus tamaricis TaxID=2705421 RepID=A0A6B2JMI1_9RHOB|nr:nucleotidyltransferase family protein [Pseudoroseicyclus tamaricis]
MILAAGRGTRMGPLTESRPKPLIEVAGRPLIEHALALTEPLMPLTRVVNLHYRGAQIRAHLGDRVVYSEEPELLESGGGLRAALPLLGPAPCFVLNADAAWERQTALAELAATWDAERMDALLLLIPRANATGHPGKGDFDLAADGRITRGTGYIYPGAHITRTEGLAGIPEAAFSLNVLWDRMIAAGRLYGLVHHGGWVDVGQPGSLPLAEELLARV